MGRHNRYKCWRHEQGLVQRSVRSKRPEPGIAALLCLALLCRVVAAGDIVSGDVCRHPSPEGHACFRDINRQILNTLGPYISGFPGKTALVDVAIHPNIGDNLLWLGAKNLFFKAAGNTPDLICSGQQHSPLQPQFPKCPPPAQMLAALGTPAMLLWHAGGNFGDTYYAIQRYRNAYMKGLDQELAVNPAFKGWNITMVHLPQSIFYSNATLMEHDKALYATFKHLKVHITSRTQYGVDVIGTGLGMPIKPCPDMVYMIGPVQTINPAERDILLLMRLDTEAKVTFYRARELAKEFLGPLNITLDVKDWPWELEANSNKPQAVWADLADVRLNAGMNLLSSGKVIITNRLHAAVLASLMGIPCIWYDGSAIAGYSKIGSTLSLARAVGPTCTDDGLRSWEAKVPAGKTEEDAFRLALDMAVEQLRKLLA